MATTTEQQQRAVRALGSVGAALRDLPRVAAEWETLDDGEQMSWAIQWSNEMAKLERLSRSAAEGSLVADQDERYRQLVESANSLAPVIRRLKLYRPRLPASV
ncbi:MAG: hypothetical protein H0V51_05465 [Chloroflexi bacterium]|nr:hypothetical protein [Chloroflexota bacterium]